MRSELPRNARFLLLLFSSHLGGDAWGKKLKRMAGCQSASSYGAVTTSVRTHGPTQRTWILQPPYGGEGGQEVRQSLCKPFGDRREKRRLQSAHKREQIISLLFLPGHDCREPGRAFSPVLAIVAHRCRRSSPSARPLAGTPAETVRKDCVRDFRG